MALSPVMVRELRAESRRPFSYWLRVLGVAAVLVACFSAVRTQEVIEINLAMSGLPASQWPPFASRPPLPDPAQVLGSLLFGNVNAALFVALFMAIININLGVLNLLPIPILDGGHILFLGIEAIRRKPLSEKVIALSQKIGLAIILTLMAFVIYNDFVRLITLDS